MNLEFAYKKLTIIFKKADKSILISCQVITDYEAVRLIEHIESIPGIRYTDISELIINHETMSTNDIITIGRIKASFRKEQLLRKDEIYIKNIYVNVSNGVVYLKGTVKNYSQAKLAIHLAKLTPKVTKVVSILFIDKANSNK